MLFDHNKEGSSDACYHEGIVQSVLSEEPGRKDHPLYNPIHVKSLETQNRLMAARGSKEAAWGDGE